MQEPCLVVEGVSLAYGDVLALDDVSFAVDGGERVALLGPSGAGKSSLLSLLTTERRPTSGSVRLFGQPLEHLAPSERRRLRRRLGLVEQQPPLPGALRVVHNVNAGRLGHWSTWRALSSLVRPRGLQEAQAALDRLGIGDKLYRRTDELSGGERQRVALARLLIQGAELVLADEPVANLDPARSFEVLALLCGGDRTSTIGPSFGTVIVSLHDVDLARRHCDRIIGLREGRIAFDCPAGELSAEHTERLYDLTGGP